MCLKYNEVLSNRIQKNQIYYKLDKILEFATTKMQSTLGNHKDFDWATSINYLYSNFHKITLHTNTFLIHKITPSWFTMQESVRVNLIWNIYQILVLFCFSFFSIQHSFYLFIFIFFIFFPSWFVFRFFKKREGLWQGKLCTFQPFF